MKTHRFALVALTALGLCAGSAHAQTPPPAPPVPPPPHDIEGQVQKHVEKAKEHSGKAWKDEGGQVFTDRSSRTFTVSDGTTLVLANVAGTISVSAVPGSEITLDMARHVKAPSEEEGRRRLEEARVEIEERAGRVEVRTSGPGRHRGWVDYTVTAPPQTMVEVRSVSGDVSVDGIKGEVRVETVSGDVKASGLARKSSVKAVSGDVSVAASALDGELIAQSVSGNVVLKQVKGRELNLGSVSGNVTISAGACERALVRSVSGNLDMAGALSKGGRYELKSHSGTVKLQVDGKTGFEVNADSFSGDIRADMPLDVKSKTEHTGYGPPSRTLRAIYLDGSAQVELSSFSGTIVISKKATQ
jgi:DUF4097 and DUF4098 domain-containing protein YvlB